MRAVVYELSEDASQLNSERYQSLLEESFLLLAIRLIRVYHSETGIVISDTVLSELTENKFLLEGTSS